MNENYDRLNEFVKEQGGNTDDLTLDEMDEAELKLHKVNGFERRDMGDRADTLRREVRDMVGADEDDSNDNREKVVELLSNHDLETLNAPWKIEEEIQTLKAKRETFEARRIESRVQELDNEIEVLEAAKDEVHHAQKGYEDIDTLAGRIVRDGSVLTATFSEDGMDLDSRPTGDTVTLVESDSNKDVDTYSRPLGIREVNQAINQVVEETFRGNN